MRFLPLGLIPALILVSTVPAIAAAHPRRGPTSSRAFSRHAAPRPRLAGQRAIDDGRATEIQTALIRNGYLTGEPSGHWDTQTEAAMSRLQGDNGWQTKLVPDSRAIIKLGLGPAAIAPGAPLAPDASIATPSGALAER
jgi:peptidoglycan hydrolase-like protein with peptidoglycan-binding domain